MAYKKQRVRERYAVTLYFCNLYEFPCKVFPHLVSHSHREARVANWQSVRVFHIALQASSFQRAADRGIFTRHRRGINNLTPDYTNKPGV